MARRHVYTGMYTRHRRRPAVAVPSCNHSDVDRKTFSDFADMLSQYVWTGYNMIYGNYMVLATVFAVVLLSFLIPDISQKIHTTTELNSIKKVLDVMTAEVSRAEAACLTAANEICSLQNSVQDSSTETDISIFASDYPEPIASEPLQVEGQIGVFQHTLFPHSNTSHKEIAIMSYLYTDSFNADKTVENQLQDYHHNDPDCV